MEAKDTLRATINEDVFSLFNKTDKKRKPLLKKGDEVRIIDCIGQVLIVEDKKGERWPVNINHVIIKENN